MRFLLVYKDAATGIQRSKHVTLDELKWFRDMTLEEFFNMQ